MYETTKTAIQAAIYTNSSQSITGNLLQQTLIDFCDSVGTDSGFGGLATSGSGAAINAGDTKTWLLCVNDTASVISYPRYIAGTVTQLSPGGVAILYNIGNGWEWKNLCGNASDTNSVLGKIASIVSAIGDNATPNTILYRILALENDSSAHDDALIAHAVSRGVHMVLQGDVDDIVELLDEGIEFACIVFDNEIKTASRITLDDSNEHHAYILFDWRNVSVPPNIWTNLHHCNSIEFPSTIEKIDEVAANHDELPTMKWVFNNVTPPNAGDGTIFADFGGCYCHDIVKQDYEAALPNAGGFHSISY